jgi:hypothetical protein
MNFYDFYDMLNGKMYSDPRVPPPVEYELQDYMAQITSNPDNVVGIDGRDSNYALQPITRMWTHSADDVVDFMTKHGRNTKKLGEPLDDEGLRRYTGIKPRSK